MAPTRMHVNCAHNCDVKELSVCYCQMGCQHAHNHHARDMFVLALDRWWTMGQTTSILTNASCRALPVSFYTREPTSNVVVPRVMLFSGQTASVLNMHYSIDPFRTDYIWQWHTMQVQHAAHVVHNQAAQQPGALGQVLPCTAISHGHHHCSSALTACQQ